MYSYNKNKKKLNYMILIIMILVISIGYAVLSTNLNIVGAGTINNPTWNIHWENVQVKTGSVSASTPTIDTAKTTVNYSVTLTIPGDYYEFTVDAVNSGTIDGMVSVISNKLNNVEITTLPNYLEYKVTYEDGVEIAPKHLLAAGTSEKYKVHVGYKKDISVSDIPATPQTLNLSFSVTYVQSDSNAIEVAHRITKYSVNGNESIWIGRAPSSNITLYDTASEARQAFYNEPYYLKHVLESDIVIDSYVCFELNNSNYCIRGQQLYDDSDECKSGFIVGNNCLSTYYESNKSILREAFGESNCNDYSSNYSCSNSMSGLVVSASNYGDVAADTGSVICRVYGDGSSGCFTW